MSRVTCMIVFVIKNSVSIWQSQIKNSYSFSPSLWYLDKHERETHSMETVVLYNRGNRNTRAIFILGLTF